MTRKELKEILEEHKNWINGVEEGKRADLRGADLRGADLRGADLDFSCLPIWCGSLGVHMDDKQIIQILYHLIINAKYSKNIDEGIKYLLLTDNLINLANKFHRADECGVISKEN